MQPYGRTSDSQTMEHASLCRSETLATRSVPTCSNILKADILFIICLAFNSLWSLNVYITSIINDKYANSTPIRVARLFLDCNGDFAIKAYWIELKVIDNIKRASNISYLPESLNLLEASFLVHRAPFFRPKCLPLRGHMTAEVHRRWGGELVPLVAVHGRLSDFDFDGFSHFSL